MRLYGIDYMAKPPRPVLWLHAEVDQARTWLREGLRRVLVEVPGHPRQMSVIERAERYGRMLGSTPRGRRWVP